MRNVYVIETNDSGLFGIYTTIKRAVSAASFLIANSASYYEEPKVDVDGIRVEYFSDYPRGHVTEGSVKDGASALKNGASSIAMTHRQTSTRATISVWELNN